MIGAALPAVVQDLQAGNGGELSVILVDSGRLDRIDVYTDLSLTMRAYDRSDSTPFGRLLTSLDDLPASKVAFYGFGFPGGAGQRVDTLRAASELRDPLRYAYLNNDYAELFRRFEPRDGRTRLVITDLVQSSALERDPARLGAVTEQLHRWVAAGGSVTILFYRTPYRGRYYSDFTDRDPIYDCDRPLAVLVFASSALVEQDLLARLGSDLKPDYVVRTGVTELEVQPVEEVLTRPGERRRMQVLRDVDTTALAGYRNIPGAVVVERSGQSSRGFVPLQFDVRANLDRLPWSALGRERTRTFVASLRPEVRVWPAGPRRARRGRDSARVQDDLLTRSLKPELGEPPAPVFPDSSNRGNIVAARFTVPMRRPPIRERHFLLSVAFRPAAAAIREFVPTELTTDADLSADACGRILKLRSTMGDLLANSYVPGRLVMFTDWK